MAAPVCHGTVALVDHDALTGSAGARRAVPGLLGRRRGRAAGYRCCIRRSGQACPERPTSARGSNARH